MGEYNAALNERRTRPDLQSPVEWRAADLNWAIEKMGHHPLLSEAQRKVDEAHALLAKWHLEGEVGGRTNRYDPHEDDKIHERFVIKVPGIFSRDLAVTALETTMREVLVTAALVTATTEDGQPVFSIVQGCSANTTPEKALEQLLAWITESQPGFIVTNYLQTLISSSADCTISQPTTNVDPSMGDSS